MRLYATLLMRFIVLTTQFHIKWFMLGEIEICVNLFFFWVSLLVDALPLSSHRGHSHHVTRARARLSCVQTIISPPAAALDAAFVQRFETWRDRQLFPCIPACLFLPPRGTDGGGRVGRLRNPPRQCEPWQCNLQQMAQEKWQICAQNAPV